MLSGLLALGLILAAVWWVWTPTQRAAPVPPVTPATSAAAPRGTNDSPGSKQLALPPATTPALVEAIAVPTLEEASGAAPPPAVVRGRVLLPDGRPAAGVKWRLRDLGVEAEHDKAQRAGVTDVEGKFAADVLVSNRLRLTLEPVGFATVSWDLPWVKVGTVHDLGDTVVELGGSIVGRVVDLEGRPLRSGWTARAEQPGPSFFIGEDHRVDRVVAQPRGEDGTFVIEALRPGLTTVSVIVEAGQPILGPVVQVEAGRTHEVTLHYTGPPLDTRVTVRFVLPPDVPGFVPDAEHVRLRGGPDGDLGPIVLSSEQTLLQHMFGGSAGDLADVVFENVPDVAHVLEVDDPAFEPVRMEGIRPGPSVVFVHLVGSTTLHMEVRDAATREPVETFKLSANIARTATNGVRTQTGAGLSDGDHAGGTATVAGLMSWPHELMVEAPGYQVWKKEWEGGAAGASAIVTALLIRGAEIAGVVVDDVGHPVSGISVGLFDAGIEQDGSLAMFLTQEQYWRIWPIPPFKHVERAITTTDEAGRFRFSGLEDGPVCVRAWRSPTVDAFVDEVNAVAGTILPDLQLVLPVGRFVLGKILLPESSTSRPLTIAGAHVEPRVPKAMPAVAAVAEDGSFRLGPFTPGAVALCAHVASGWQPVELLPSSEGAEAPGNRLPLGSVVLSADRDLDVVFDLGTGFPGRARLRVLVDGEPVPGLEVALAAADGSARHGYGRPGPDGWAELGALLPGAFDVWVRQDGDHGWIVQLPQSIVVESGATVEQQVGIARVPGTVICLDSTTELPLGPGERIVMRERFAGNVRDTTVTTDANGCLQLRRPAGTFWLEREVPFSFHDHEKPTMESLADMTAIEWPGGVPFSFTVRL